MTYLDNYLKPFEDRGEIDLANSVRKTATDVGMQHLKNFDYRSHQIGLLFGNIQSGKTAQVFGIASKAVDLGFPFFLMLTTDNRVLQEQTYKRAEQDLNDFVVCGENEEQKMLQHGNHPVMLVVKKNANVLKTWANRLKASHILVGNPLFIIDDEADAASLNTMVNKKQQSSINRYLEHIRDNASSSIYLQVTGTPQALVLQSLESNWHPMFTYYFKPGDSYLGGNFFFPDRKSVPTFVHFIDDSSEDDSIKDMVIRHLVVSAQILLTGGQVSNALIHPGVRTVAHAESRKELHTALAWCTFNNANPQFIDKIRQEYDSISPDKATKVPFVNIQSKINFILENHDYQIVTLNGTSADSSVDYATGCNFVIGGLTLGRGVTFKHLNTFYYTRTSKNPQADTMWQHNRLFGYDRDPGLVSVYISRELYKLFVEINDTNNSIIDQAASGSKISVSYPDGLKPTRNNVLDQSKVSIQIGGKNYYPLYPKNRTFDQISELVKQFGDREPASSVNLGLILEILKHFSTEDSFHLDGYTQIINSIMSREPMTQGRLLVRRNRAITWNTGALLSPNDWNEGFKYNDQVVVTLYEINGGDHQGWMQYPIWVPNIKLPTDYNFYLV
jgi:hypothetical protein